jgi:glutamate-5-semialdehyde dehydrogenase
VVGTSFSRDRLVSCIVNSLDRKVCNTLNTLVVLEQNSETALSAVAEALRIVGNRQGSVVVHCTDEVGSSIDSHGSVDIRSDGVDPGEEWEWDATPEITLLVKPSIADAVSDFNRYSPRFVLSVISDDTDEITMAWENSESPFFGDGFTRWVDGQFALNRPELGLANWQHGRLLGRGGVLSGDGVHSVRLRVNQSDPQLHR